MRRRPIRERRLSDGAYRRLHERGELPWQESARPYVLDAVDRAKDWNDLHQRLGAHGVVVKLVRRGERVQGLAFAEGLDRRAPGARRHALIRAVHCGRWSRDSVRSRPRANLSLTLRAPRAWADTVRPTILAAVDSAKTWERSRRSVSIAMASSSS